MKICMLVYNNGTRDGRVMKEAHSLRSAGHEVTVIGVPDDDAEGTRRISAATACACTA